MTGRYVSVREALLSGMHSSLMHAFPASTASSRVTRVWQQTSKLHQCSSLQVTTRTEYELDIRSTLDLDRNKSIGSDIKGAFDLVRFLFHAETTTVNAMRAFHATSRT